MALAMSLRAEDKLRIGWEENDVASYPNRRWKTRLDHGAMVPCEMNDETHRFSIFKSWTWLRDN